MGTEPRLVTSFADGSKISFEQAIVANATGFVVKSRGMSRGLEYKGDVMKIGSLYDIEELRRLGGVIDYVVGTPLTKVYCLAEHTDPKQQHYLNLYKMGDGPLYSFFTPYHLVHFEVPNAIARVALFGDSVAKPLGGPVVEVCAIAKRDLKEGEVLDDYGMYMTYGEAVNADEMCSGRYLPEGLVEGCKLKRAVPKDQIITYNDVELPPNRLADRLRAEQYTHFRGDRWLENLLPSEGNVGATGKGGTDRRSKPVPVPVYGYQLLVERVMRCAQRIALGAQLGVQCLRRLSTSGELLHLLLRRAELALQISHACGCRRQRRCARRARHRTVAAAG